MKRGRGDSHIFLPPDELPRMWYNVLPDLPKPLPPLKDPEEGPPKIELMRRLFTKTAMGLEYSDARWIPIPDEIREMYIHIGRPRPLYRALRLERHLRTPARIYYKREDLAPTGSFKMNTLIPQVYYAHKEGYQRITACTGAGQVGTAAAYAAAMFGMKCAVYWVRHACRLKPDRVAFNRMLGADVYESPSLQTEAGKRYLKENPDHPGTLGIGYAEAFEDALSHDDTVAIWGSRMNHVILHHTIIGLETKRQLEMVDEKPDILLSCAGTGSNLPGLIFPFLKDRLDGRLGYVRFVAAQSEAAPTLTKGEYRYDFPEPSKSTPLMKMYTLGLDAKLPMIRAEGIRSASSSPTLSSLRAEGLIDVLTYAADERKVFEAASTFLQVEGVPVALESAYAVKAAMDEAIRARRERKKKVIVFNISGSGYLDFGGFREVLPGL